MNQVDDVIVKAWRKILPATKVSLAAKYEETKVALLISVTEVIAEWNMSMFYGYYGLDNWNATPTGHIEV